MPIILNFFDLCSEAFSRNKPIFLKSVRQNGPVEPISVASDASDKKEKQVSTIVWLQKKTMTAGTESNSIISGNLLSSNSLLRKVTS